MIAALDADLYSLKVMDSAGEGSEEALIQALNWVAEQKIQTEKIVLCSISHAYGLRVPNLEFTARLF